jgi:hypothetical protein
VITTNRCPDQPPTPTLPPTQTPIPTPVPISEYITQITPVLPIICPLGLVFLIFVVIEIRRRR